MAKCAACGKTKKYGKNQPWSRKATNHTFKPNLQKITVHENGKSVRKVMCTRCIRTMVKTAA